LASQKSFQKKDGDDNPPGQFRGDKRRNDTHESKTDPDARLYRKGNGQEAKPGYLGHVLMENRHGFIVDAAFVASEVAIITIWLSPWRSLFLRVPRFNR